MFEKLPGYLAVLGLGFSSLAVAGTAEVKALVEQNKFQQAYQAANKHLQQYEGDPEFDLQYGIAAIDSGHLSEGVFALDRVLLVQPGNALAKLELARAYFILGQLDKSGFLFQQVQKLNPPDNVRLRIAEFLALIEQQSSAPPTRFTSFIELWGGYDSNINSGPDAQTSLVALTDSALGRGDQYSQVKFGSSVEHQYSATGHLNFHFSADLRFHHTEQEQDYRNVTVSGGHTWYSDEQRYLLNFIAQKYVLDDAEYRDLLGVNLGWDTELSRQSVLKSFLSVNQLTYDEIDWKDATQASVGVNYLYAGSGDWKPIYFAGMFMGEEDPETSGLLADSQVHRRFYGGNLGVQLTPYPSVTVTPALTFQTSKYQGEDWIYNIKRQDDFRLLNLNISWKVAQSWVVQANYSYTEADSNIELYEYDRQQIMFGLRYNFQ